MPDPLSLASPQVSFVGPDLLATIQEAPPGPKHPSYLEQYSSWVLIRDCIAGEQRIKSRRTTYLPTLEKQTTKNYEHYLRYAYFLNGVEKTVTQLTGQVFRRRPSFSHIPSSLPISRITKSGESLETFLQTVVREILTTGRYGILLDRPVSPALSPYLAGYRAEDILMWRVQEINGLFQLTLVVLHESVEVFNEEKFKIETYSQLRFLRLVPDKVPGTYRYIQEIRDPKELTLISTVIPTHRGSPLNYIPFQFFGPYALTPEMPKPPLLDIAFVNLSHYRSTADLEQGRHYAATPTYYIKGAGINNQPSGEGPAQEFIVGPNNIWMLDSGDEADILEFKGEGLKYLENAVTSKEAQMLSLGSRLVGQQEKTAAQSKLQTSEQAQGERSVLLSITNIVNSGVSNLLEWMRIWEDAPLSEGKPPSVELNQEFGDTIITARELRAIESLYESGMLPPEGLYKTFRDAGVIPSSMDFDEFETMLKERIAERNRLLAEQAAAGSPPGRQTEGAIP